jgi:hypothetical protein
MVVWEGGYNAYQYFVHQRRKILGQLVDSAGTFGSEFDVRGSLDYRAVSPDVAADGQGQFVVVWSEVTSYDYSYTGPFLERHPNFAVRGRRVDESGTVTGATTEVGEGGSHGPHVSADAAGNYVVAWARTDDEGSSEVLARRYDAASTALGTEFRVSKAPVSEGGLSNAGVSGVDVGAALDGSFAVAWSSGGAGFEGSTDGSSLGLFARSFGADGAPAAGVVALNTFTAGAQSAPAIAFTDPDALAIAWQSEDQDGSGLAIVARRFSHSTEPCAAQPLTGCMVGGARLTVRNHPLDDTKDMLKWTWLQGDGFDQNVLGDPRTSTTYTLCIYDTAGSMPSLATTLTVGPADLWADKSPHGLQYKDATMSSHGVAKIGIRTGAAKSRIVLLAKSGNTPMPAPISGTKYFEQDPEVVVQLLNHSDACWTSAFAPERTTANDGSRFRAKAP